MNKVTPFLWFNDNLQAALDFYTATFANTRIIDTTPGPGGQLMAATFEIEGQRLLGLNGGPMFKFNESISLFVNCETQAEVDALWTRLTSDGGAPSRCGWLKDQFGLWWQIVPTVLGTLLRDPDRAKSQRVMNAMLTMGKIDIHALEAAAKG